MGLRRIWELRHQRAKQQPYVVKTMESIPNALGVPRHLPRGNDRIIAVMGQLPDLWLFSIELLLYLSKTAGCVTHHFGKSHVPIRIMLGVEDDLTLLADLHLELGLRSW